MTSPKWSRLRWAGVGVSALLATVVAVSVGLGGRPWRLEGGPLLAGGDGGLLCIRKGPGTEISFGFTLLRNTGGAPLTLQAVHLVAPVGVTMVSAEVVPVTYNLIGALHGYPPPADSLRQPGVDWAGRQPLTGASLEAGAQLNLLVRLTDPPSVDVTGFDALRIDYTVHGLQYAATTTIRFRIRPTCAVPDRAAYH